MRRNTKTMYEWRKAYRDKEELMLERGFPEVSPHEFYRDLFPEGSLQSAEHDGKGNLIARAIRKRVSRAVARLCSLEQARCLSSTQRTMRTP